VTVSIKKFEYVTLHLIHLIFKIRTFDLWKIVMDPFSPKNQVLVRILKALRPWREKFLATGATFVIPNITSTELAHHNISSPQKNKKQDLVLQIKI
jgi:hypothetical protein